MFEWFIKHIKGTKSLDFQLSVCLWVRKMAVNLNNRFEIHSVCDSFEVGWSRKWIFLLTRKSKFFRKYFYLRVITRNYA
jgi:hypothetical protein